MADERPYKVLLLLPQCGLTEGQAGDLMQRIRFVGGCQEQWHLYIGADDLNKPDKIDPVINYLVEKTRTLAALLLLPVKGYAAGTLNDDSWLYAWARDNECDEVWCCVSIRQERRGRPARVFSLAQSMGGLLANRFKKIPAWVEGAPEARYLDIGAKAGHDMRKGKTWNGKF